MIIAFDSLKFYKLKNENTAKILFAVLYVIILFSYANPFGTRMSPEYILDTLQDSPAALYSEIGSGQVIYYGISFLVYLIASFVALIYANCMVMEAEDFPNRKAVKASFTRLPQIISFMLMLLVVAVFSSILAFIPLIIAYYITFLVPLLVTEGRKSVIKSISESFIYTRGFKISIFFTQLTIYFIMSIPISLFSASFMSMGYQNTMAEYLVLSFLRAAYILMTGRMLGNFYILLVKKNNLFKKIKISLLRPGTQFDESDEDDEDENQDDE